MFGPLPDDIELSFEGDFAHPALAADEDLLNIGLRGARDASDGIDVQRGIAPSENFQAFFADNPFEHAFDEQARRMLHGQKDQTGAVFAGGGQGEAFFGAFAREKSVGDLNKESGAVAGLRIAATGSAVRQIDEDLDALGNDIVRFVAVDVHHEANPAGIAFVGRIVQALRRR